MGERPPRRLRGIIALATLIFVVPPALVASSIDYNVAGTVRLVRDVFREGFPPPPAWVGEIEREVVQLPGRERDQPEAGHPRYAEDFL